MTITEICSAKTIPHFNPFRYILCNPNYPRFYINLLSPSAHLDPPLHRCINSFHFAVASLICQFCNRNRIALPSRNIKPFWCVIPFYLSHDIWYVRAGRAVRASQRMVFLLLCAGKSYSTFISNTLTIDRFSVKPRRQCASESRFRVRIWMRRQTGEVCGRAGNSIHRKV